MSSKPFWTTAKPASKRLSGSYAELVAARVSLNTVPAYDRGASYALGSLLDHHIYGVGVVVHVPGRGKVLVRFADSDRLLVCGAAPGH